MKRMLASALLLTGLLLCAPSFADEPRSSFDKVTDLKAAPSTTVRGTVVASGGRSLAIETPAGNRMDFEVDSDSEVPGGLVSGTEVLVTYGPRDTGINRVLRVDPVKAVPREEPVAARGQPVPLAAPPTGVAAPLRQGAPPLMRAEPLRQGAPLTRAEPTLVRETSKRPLPLAGAVLAGLLLLGGTVAVWLKMRP